MGHRPPLDTRAQDIPHGTGGSRTDTDEAHRTACSKKLAVLLTQKADLSIAIEELLDDIESGRKYMKVYKQMKMYNDPSLNPVLYGKK